MRERNKDRDRSSRIPFSLWKDRHPDFCKEVSLITNADIKTSSLAMVFNELPKRKPR